MKWQWEPELSNQQTDWQPLIVQLNFKHRTKHIADFHINLGFILCINNGISSVLNKHIWHMKLYVNIKNGNIKKYYSFESKAQGHTMCFQLKCLIVCLAQLKLNTNRCHVVFNY